MRGGGVRFHLEGRLPDFVRRRRRPASFTAEVPPHATVKDALESFGIPHTEIGGIRLDGVHADFAARLEAGQDVVVTPAAAHAPSILRPPPPEPPRFVLDTHLGRLARLLRLTGFDSVYSNDAADDALANLSAEEDRILLTRDLGLLMRRRVTHGYRVWATDPEQQLQEVLDRFGARLGVRPFTRCLRCNGTLEAVEKAAVLDVLQPLTKRWFEAFRRCNSCGQVYWEGSHMLRLDALVDAARRS